MNHLRKIGLWLFRIFWVLLVLVVVLLFVLQIPSVQRYVTHQVANYLEKKLETRVDIAGVYYRFPSTLTMQEVYVEDLNKDTLVYLERAAIELNWQEIWHKKLIINSVVLENASINLSITETNANFGFIEEAFADGRDSTKIALQTPAKPKKDGWQLSFAKADLGIKKTRFRYRSDLVGQELNLFLQDFHGKVKEIDLANFIFDLKSIDLSDSRVLVELFPRVQLSNKDTTKNAKTYTIRYDTATLNRLLVEVQLLNVDLAVNLEKFSSEEGQLHLEDGVGLTMEAFQLRESSLDIDLANTPIAKKGFDASHIHWSDMNMIVRDFRYKDLDIAAYFDTLRLIDDKGFNFKHLDGQAYFNKERLILENTTIKTERSIVYTPNTTLYYNFIKRVRPLEDLGFDVTLAHSRLDIQDAQYFAPAVAQLPFKKTVFNIKQTLIGGSLRALTFDKVNIATGQTTLKGRATIANPLDASNLRFDLTVDELKTQKSDFEKWLPKNTIPDSIVLPDAIAIAGTLQGNSSDFKTQLTTTIRRKADASATYARLSAAVKNPTDLEKLHLEVIVDTLSMPQSEILAYVPKSLLPKAIELPPQIALKGRAKGTLANLKTKATINVLRKQQISTIGISGTAFNLLQKPEFKIDLLPSQLNATEILSYLPKNALPPYIQIPNITDVKGGLNGSADSLNTTIQFKYKGSQVNAKGFLSGKHYAFDVAVKKLNIQDWFAPAAYDSIVGLPLEELDVTANFQGRGFDLPTLAGLFKFRVKRPQDAEGVSISGAIKAQTIVGNIRAKEQDMTIYSTVKANLATHKTVLKVDTLAIDLQRLKLVEQPIAVHMKALNSTINGNSLENFYIHLKEQQFGLQYDTTLFTANNINGLINLKDTEDKRIELNSDEFDLTLAGQFDETMLAANMRKFASVYFNISDTAIVLPQERFQLDLNLRNTDLLTSGIVPNLKKLTPFKVKMNYNSIMQHMNVVTAIDTVAFLGFELDSFDLKVDTDRTSAKLHVAVGDANYADFAHLGATNFTADLANRSLKTNLIQLDSAGTVQTQLATQLEILNNQLRLQLPANQIINYENWTIADSNRLVFTPQVGFEIDNWKLTHENDTQYVQIFAETQTRITAIANQFDIEGITRFVNINSDILDGELNGFITLYNLLETPQFLSKMVIKDLTILETPYGNLDVSTEYANADRLALLAVLTGESNDVTLTGNYYLKDSMDLDLKIDSFNVALLQPFAAFYLDSLSGKISGSTSLDGSTSKPVYFGLMAFDTVAFRVKLINQFIRLGNEPFILDSQSVFVSGLTAFDEDNNTAKVDANIKFKDLTQLKDYYIIVDTESFNLLNTSNKDNELYFGKLTAQGFVKITTEEGLPFINVIQATPKLGSEVTYIYPSATYKQVESHEGIVEFMTTKPIKKSSLRPDKMLTYPYKMSANTRVNENIELTVLIDPLTKDRFVGRGKGDINVILHPDGTIELYGSVEVIEGTYWFTYQDIIQREFKVLAGSKISWTGDPYNPSLDLKIQYHVKTTPYALVQRQNSEVIDDGELRRRETFYMQLEMKGSLEKVDITADILYPNLATNSGNPDIENALAKLRNDAGQLNTQAFGLLLFSGFIADNIGSTITSSINLANSVGDLITSQLNQLANQYIRFVELDFGLEDGGEGETDYRVSVKKRFLNDRLSVSLDGVAKTSANSSEDNNVYLDNVTVEYKLTEDGRFKVKLYNQSERDNFLDENVFKFGGSLVFSRDFERLFFKKKKKN